MPAAPARRSTGATCSVPLGSAGDRGPRCPCGCRRHPPPRAGSPRRAASVFCNGPLLDAVQRSGLFGDCKIFGFATARWIEEAPAAEALPVGATTEQLRAFVSDHFERPALTSCRGRPSTTWRSRRRLRASRTMPCASGRSRSIASGHQRPRQAANNPQRRTLLPMPHPFVVPGGRFVETYYWGARTALGSLGPKSFTALEKCAARRWCARASLLLPVPPADSYWIVKGLLTCSMRETARGMVLNLLHQLKTFGFPVAADASTTSTALSHRCSPICCSR